MASRRANSTSTGRKKIEIRLIESEEARKVCFSKRRAGLFNKLTALSVMCGAKVAAVAFSPGGKAFFLGHPSVESVVDRVRTSNSSQAQDVAAVDGGAGDRNLALAELNREHGEVCERLAEIKARSKAVDEYMEKAHAEGSQAAAWLALANDVSQMGEEDRAAFAAVLAKVRADVAMRSEQVLKDALLVGHIMSGGGEFELGGTSASGGMELTHQQQQLMMMMEELKMELAQPPPPTGFAAGAEMQQQQMMMAMQPAPTGFNTGTEMMQQHQMMMATPPPPIGVLPPPPLLGFDTGMGHQGFGPHGFP